MNIYLRKDGRYESRIPNGKKDGKRTFLYVLARTKEQCIEKVNAIRQRNQPQGCCSMTVSELFAEWHRSIMHCVKESTAANYTMKANKHILPALGGLTVSEVTANHVYTFIADILFMPEILNKFQQQGAKKLEEITGGTFTRYTDYYCLAYHIHMLLMAQKPYGAALDKTDIENSVPAPTPKSMACRGQYAYVNLPARASLPKIYPNFDIITPKLQNLFIRAFRDGSSDPTKRPDAQEFLEALEEYTSGLRFCKCDGFDHYLYKNYRKPHCEWCRVEQEKQQERQITFEDIQWMTEDELLHLAEITSDQLRTVTYLELGRRYTGIPKTGVKAKPDNRKAKKYLKKCISSAKRGRDDKFITMTKGILKSLK